MKKVQSVGKIGLNLQQPLSRKDEEWLQKKVKRRVEQGSGQSIHASWDEAVEGMRLPWEWCALTRHSDDREEAQQSLDP
jgi:hypothetical protein